MIHIKHVTISMLSAGFFVGLSLGAFLHFAINKIGLSEIIYFPLMVISMIATIVIYSRGDN